MVCGFIHNILKVRCYHILSKEVYCVLFFVQMYRRNEEEFEHDLQRFMIRHDRTIRRSPTWHGIPISHFQLFLAVYDKGGFYKVRH